MDDRLSRQSLELVQQQTHQLRVQFFHVDAFTEAIGEEDPERHHGFLLDRIWNSPFVVVAVAVALLLWTLSFDTGDATVELVLAMR